MSEYLLTIDQGTTSTRAIVFDKRGVLCGQHQMPFQQFFPGDGWVEHDLEEIWQTTLVCCREAIARAGLGPQQISAIGITNQRETTAIWDRFTGKPIHRAIVWQDRRTAASCHQLSTPNNIGLVKRKTGLVIDPYFSASKIAWILQHVPGAQQRAEQSELVFGTIDSFLLWRLTGGKVHATDPTNAGRTLLFNIHTQSWDQELLDLFNIPIQILPQVFDNCANFGVTESSLLGASIPIVAMAGDQQAALIGEACFKPGALKITYGTGCFLLQNTGKEVLQSSHHLLSTIAYRIKGQVAYALEGSIFAAGTIVQWLRDQIGLIKQSSDSEAMAASLSDNQGVYFVPAFTGLGAPHWNPNVRAAIFGMTRDTRPAHIVRAGLEAIAYQTRDLLNAMIEDGSVPPESIRVDGGMVANNWLVQFLADILQTPIERPRVIETTALGVAYLAGLQIGIYKSVNDIEYNWQLDQRFTPKLPAETADIWYRGWEEVIKKVQNS